MPTSKPIAELLARTKPELIVIDGDGGWRESALVPATFVHADPAADRACARRAAPGAGPATSASPHGPPDWLARRPRRGRGDGRLAGRARRAVRGRAVPGARGRAAGRVHAVGRATRCPSATWTAGCRRPSARSPSARTAARTGSTASCRRRSGSAAVAAGAGRARRRRRVVPPRPQRARRREAPRPVRDDRPRQQRWRRHLLVPAAGARPPSPGPASRTATRSCSGRRTGSTSGRS